ncbi:hypothetical protein B2J93_6671 [Marssonina coronariae]|uniref:Uncharacterized protein n=1 Tax=Diplocarpon coronariae TaxID=2795749 RepID=A0A218ZG80_9HELO|nr:hypothetical protein B2J93_6671 [Marssonina coronariae]
MFPAPSRGSRFATTEHATATSQKSHRFAASTKSRTRAGAGASSPCIQTLPCLPAHLAAHSPHGLSIQPPSVNNKMLTELLASHDDNPTQPHRCGMGSTARRDVPAPPGITLGLDTGAELSRSLPADSQPAHGEKHCPGGISLGLTHPVPFDTVSWPTRPDPEAFM